MEKICLKSTPLSHTQTMEKQSVSMVTLTQKEADEYCAYKRQKKISEIMEALRRTGSELTANDSAVRLGEQALRLRQASIKMTPVELLYRGMSIRKNGVRVDCIVGGNGETFARVKAYEAKRALKEGAKEITLILTPSLVANCRYTELRKEIKGARRAIKRAILKARVEKIYPQATLERLIKLCGELGVDYFSLPYFAGCERLQTVGKGGCRLEISGIDTLPLFKEMARAGIGRMIVKRAWELYSEWLKETENIAVGEGENSPATEEMEGLEKNTIIGKSGRKKCMRMRSLS